MKKIFVILSLLFIMTSPAFSATDQAQLYYEAALKQVKENNLYAANRTLCEAVDVSPNSVKILKLRAKVRLELENQVGALQDLDKAISLSSNDSDLYYLKAKTLLSLQNYSDAIENYNKSIQLKSDNPDAYLYRGAAKVQAGDKDAGFKDIEHALSEYKKKGNTDLYNKGVEIRENLKNKNVEKSAPPVEDKAETYYNEALKFLNQEKKYYDAQTSATKALEIKPDFAKALKVRAVARLSLANYNGALQDLNKALSLSPNDSDLYYYKAKTFLSQQNYQGALEYYNQAIGLNQNDYKAYLERGFCKCLLGRIKMTKSYFSSALPDLEKSIQLHPDNPDAYLYRGMAKAELNGANAGLKDIEYALSEYKRKGDMDSYNKYIEIYKWIKNEY